MAVHVEDVLWTATDVSNMIFMLETLCYLKNNNFNETWHKNKSPCPRQVCLTDVYTALIPQVRPFRDLHFLPQPPTPPCVFVFICFLGTIRELSSCLLKKRTPGQKKALISSKHVTSASFGLMSQELLADAAARPIWTCDITTLARCGAALAGHWLPSLNL